MFQQIPFEQTSFDPGNKNIGPEEVKAIAESLKINETLTELNLNWNDIGPEGTKAITESLKVNKTLLLLRISGSEIPSAIAKSLKENEKYLSKSILYTPLMASLRATAGHMFAPSIYHLLPLICEFANRDYDGANQRIERTSYCQDVTRPITRHHLERCNDRTSKKRKL